MANGSGCTWSMRTPIRPRWLSCCTETRHGRTCGGIRSGHSSKPAPVVAPDLVGMGMSDKPSSLEDYTVDRHVEWMRALLIDELGLIDVDLVMHDWGGIIGMRLAANPGLANRMVISNTALPDRDPQSLFEKIEVEGPHAEFEIAAMRRCGNHGACFRW